MQLSIVAPAFDEASVVPVFIRRVLAILDGLECSAELILVYDGSCDGTWELRV
jgi:polyisoprenyl-phosphate glycosyltransferase